ncbi:MAG TPA: cytochrome c-type biogenesis protein CcmH [Solirubrobacteraceae bacterium]|jgi:cytochrome c-type biogenesis protein CcmH/NrfF|nr:cytochrome c-type biogenesis protein CcmH [Solirubrobacteraceae bacterium]
MSLRRIFVVAALVVTLGAGASFTSSAGADVSYYSAVAQFMCVSCHEPLNQVNSPQAISEKQTLRGLIAKDLSLGEIKSAMVSQYGTQVLGRPPASGFNLTVYILPPAVFLGGLALLGFTLPKWRERSRRAAATKLPGAAPLDSDDARRLDDELTKFV